MSYPGRSRAAVQSGLTAPATPGKPRVVTRPDSAHREYAGLAKS